MGRVARRAVVALAAFAVLVWTSPGRAESLSRKIETIFGENGITTVTPSHTAHFGEESFALFALLVQNLSGQASDFPATAVAPGLSFRYNDKLEIYEPTEENFSDPFVPDPRTQGKGRFEFGFSYLYLNFDTLNGNDLDHLQFRGLKHNDCCGNPPGGSPGSPAFENDTADVFYEQFTLQSQVFAFSFSYGVLDNWDVNIFLPVVYTYLDLVAQAQLHNTTNQVTHEFDPFGATRKRSFANGSNLGVGDLQLRTQYRFLESGSTRLAGILTLVVPTGSVDNFQGSGDTKISPVIAASQNFGKLDFHVASGFLVDADNTDRTRIRYGGGFTYQHLKQVAFFLDVIGSSNLEQYEVTATVPDFENIGGVETQVGTQTVSVKTRTDIVDLAPGIKIQLMPSAVAFFQAFIPMNSDGLRTSFTPAGGIEVSF